MAGLGGTGGPRGSNTEDGRVATAGPGAVAATLLDWLCALARRRPLLLCVDDAHLLDAPSLAALGFAAPGGACAHARPADALARAAELTTATHHHAALAMTAAVRGDAARPARGASAAAGLLTPQQLRIARCVAKGATNREVAVQLSVSPRTVDHHLRNVFAALGTRSRVELPRLLAEARPGGGD